MKTTALKFTCLNLRKFRQDCELATNAHNLRKISGFRESGCRALGTSWSPISYTRAPRRQHFCTTFYRSYYVTAPLRELVVTTLPLRCHYVTYGRRTASPLPLGLRPLPCCGSPLSHDGGGSERGPGLLLIVRGGWSTRLSNECSVLLRPCPRLPSSIASWMR